MPFRRLLPTALALAAACALPALAGDGEDGTDQEVWGNRTWIVDENTQIGIARFEDLYTEVLSIFRDWELVTSIGGYRFEVDGDWGPGVPLGSDVSGDGVPDLVAMEYSGGAHCCSTYYVYSLGPEIALSGVLETWDAGAAFVNLDSTPALEVESNDMSFAYWNTSFADSPAPRVVWRWDGRAYVGAPGLMAAPAPSPAELASGAARIAESDAWGSDDMDPELWRVMLDLIYSGHMEQAWDFMEAGWQPGRDGLEAFRRDFTCTLQASPWWPTVAELNAVAGPIVADCPAPG